MKWNIGHTKKPQGNWKDNRQSGYDWDEEGIDDYSYDSADADYADVEPEYLDLDPVGGSYDEAAEDGSDYENPEDYGNNFRYAEDAEYEAEASYGAGKEYARDEEYVADQEYGAGMEYASDATHEWNEFTQSMEEYRDLNDEDFYESSNGQDAYGQIPEAYADEQPRKRGYSGEDVQAGGAVYSQAQSDAADEYEEDEENDFQGEITYIEEYDEAPKATYVSRAKRRKEAEEEKSGFGVFETVIAAVGIVAILGLAGFMAWFIMSHQKPEDPHLQFAGVGKQIQGIELIGGKGIAAVANAELERLNAFAYDDPADPVEADPVEGYNEKDYKTTVAVAMSLTSVQKDLKIKFSNRETSKLVGNVRFVAQVTKPDGTTEEWIDSDMDGIIYEKGIDAGKYSVTLKALEDEKYSNYILPAAAQTVNVKKNIEYTKVDVAGEGKKESEINVSKEDTKKNETTNEGGLTDTVTWVASSMTGNTYTEVLKSSIPDPLTLPVKVAKNFLRTSGTDEPTPAPSGDPTPEPVVKTKYVVSFSANGGSGSMASSEVEEGSTFTLPECGFTAPDGQEFDEWDQGSVGSGITVNSNVTVTAKWKTKAAPVVNYQISFDANGGTGTMAAVTVTSGGTYTLPACGFTAPTGKTFDKWNKGAAGSSLTVSENVTLVAQWKDAEVAKYKVSFDANGGTGTMDEVSAPAGDYVLPECKFTAPAGKEFGKWDKGKAGDKINLTENITLKAEWVAATTPIELAVDQSKIGLQIKKAADGKTDLERATIKATVKSEKNVILTASSADSSIAAVSRDSADKNVFYVTAVAKGTTKITITADFEDETIRKPDGKSKVSKEIEVVVTEKEALALSLNKAEILCLSEVKDPVVTLEATIKNSVLKASELTEANLTKFTVESSDATVAIVTKKEFLQSSTDGTVTIRLTITPQVLLEKKSCILTVKYEEKAESASTKCTVTVKPHPKNDKVTPLLDKDEKPLFVQVGNEYRQAVYADYYVEGTKFFIQSGVKYTGWQTIDGKVYYYNAEGKFVTGEQVIQGAKYTFTSEGVLMNGSGVLGIDVSRWNGSIDWKAVKNSGVNFVIIRCGYRGSTAGSLIEDPKFTTNIKGAINAGLKVGVYFFTQAVDEVEAVYEASYVIELIKNYKITYPVFLDVEASGGRGDKISVDMRTKVCKAFCQTIQNAGYTAGIYANKTWLNEKLNVSELNAYKIWLAQYAATPTYTGRYDMWQYKSTGVINGISGDVDLNLSYMGY